MTTISSLLIGLFTEFPSVEKIKGKFGVLFRLINPQNDQDVQHVRLHLLLTSKLNLVCNTPTSVNHSHRWIYVLLNLWYIPFKGADLLQNSQFTFFEVVTSIFIWSWWNFHTVSAMYVCSIRAWHIEYNKWNIYIFLFKKKYWHFCTLFYGRNPRDFVF